jgi:hypothetical protein
MDGVAFGEGAMPVRALMHVQPFAPILPEKLPIVFHFTFEVTQVCLGGDSVCRSSSRTPLAIQHALRGSRDLPTTALDDALVLFIQNICLNDLLLNIADHKVVIGRTGIMPDALVDSLLRCLRETFGVPSVSFVNSAVAAVLSSGVWTGLAIEADYITCAVTAVVHGRALEPSSQISMSSFLQIISLIRPTNSSFLCSQLRRYIIPRCHDSVPFGCDLASMLSYLQRGRSNFSGGGPLL